MQRKVTNTLKTFNNLNHVVQVGRQIAVEYKFWWLAYPIDTAFLLSSVP